MLSAAFEFRKHLPFLFAPVNHLNFTESFVFVLCILFHTLGLSFVPDALDARQWVASGRVVSNCISSSTSNTLYGTKRSMGNIHAAVNTQQRKRAPHLGRMYINSEMNEQG